MQNNPVLPECQFDSMDVREKTHKHYAQALRYNASGARINYNLKHVAMALDILHVAQCIESIGDSEGIDRNVLLHLSLGDVLKVKKDGTWNGYRNYILNKYGVDMGVVPADAQKPTAKIIEGTIQNWLNGEPLLFY